MRTKSNENFDYRKNSMISNENANLDNRTAALNSLHEILDQNVKL